jgi:hypothetical protein
MQGCVWAKWHACVGRTWSTPNAPSKTRYACYPRDEVHGFIVDASSSFYAEFGDLIHARIDEWLDKVTPEKEEEEEEE